MKTTGGIYMVTCRSNGRRYIGSTRNFSIRWKEHRNDLKYNRHHNPHWQNAYNKYGKDDFEWVVLEELPSDDDVLRNRERHWMNIFKPEFNISLEAFPTRLGAKASPERNAKFSVSMKRMWSELTPEQRRLWNVSSRDAWANLTPEEKESRMKHLSEVRVNPSPETRAKMRESRLRYVAEHPAENPKYKSKSKRGYIYTYRPVVHTPEWESGRAEREAIRVEKLRIANTGKVRTEAQKQKLRDSANAQWADPAYREKHQAATLAAMQDPEVLQRLSDSHKGKVLSEEHKAKIRASGTGLKRSPETKARLSEARKRMWAEKRANGTADAIRAKIAASRKGQKQSEETKAKKREVWRLRKERKRLTDTTQD